MANKRTLKMKMLVLWEILRQESDAEHPLSTNDVCRKLAARGIPCEPRSLPADAALLNRYGYALCSGKIGRERYYWAPDRRSGLPGPTVTADAPRAAGFITEEQVPAVKRYWNEISDSEWYQSLRTEERLGRLREKPQTAFYPGVLELMEKYVGDFRGKRILLPSSGDNYAAFAFALMGAKVSSADISERQLEHARAISDRWNLDIEYVCDNTVCLSAFDDGSFDLVYTSNGTLTWIYDLSQMYRSVERVLKQGGYSAMFDVHPFTRPFSMEAWKAPEIRKSYQDVFPDLHWRVQDLVNAGAQAGLRVLEMAELPSADASFWYTFEELKTKNAAETAGINDWRRNPMAALPTWIAMISKKSENFRIV